MSEWRWHRDTVRACETETETWSDTRKHNEREMERVREAAVSTHNRLQTHSGHGKTEKAK